MQKIIDKDGKVILVSCEEVEKYILACLMLDNSTINDLGDIFNNEYEIAETCFLDVDNREIFRAIIDLINLNKPFDVVIVQKYLERFSVLWPRKISYLFDLVREIPSTKNCRAYCLALKNRIKVRNRKTKRNNNVNIK
jgi:replicative DNA helicase